MIMQELQHTIIITFLYNPKIIKIFLTLSICIEPSLLGLPYQKTKVQRLVTQPSWTARVSFIHTSVVKCHKSHLNFC